MIQLFNYESYLDKIGGGFTFLRHIVDNFELSDKADIIFVPNPMQVDLNILENTDKFIIARFDNIPEEKNNKGRSSNRLKKLLSMAHLMIFQSNWSLDKYVEFKELNGVEVKDKASSKVIYNGADTSIFYTGTPDENNYIYVHGKGDNKRWPEAQEIFRRIYYKNRKAVLHIVGNLALENRDYNFGFYNGEEYRFYGTQNPQGLSDIMRMCAYMIYPAFADSCPNTLIEGLNCGLKIIGLNRYGGQKEVNDLFQLDPERFSLNHMLDEYRKVFNEFNIS